MNPFSFGVGYAVPAHRPPLWSAAALKEGVRFCQLDQQS
jgi:hypothetical protein